MGRTGFTDRWRLLLGAMSAGLAGILVLVADIRATRSEPAQLDLSDYVRTFHEPFKSLDISARGPGTRWTAHTPWYGDFGEATFDDPTEAGPFDVVPHGLRITARRDPQGRWHSGLISSMDKDGPGQRGFAQRYGYFEMRAKLPDGEGTWPAFWLVGVDKRAFAAEIDVVEYYGGFPAYFHNWMHVFRNGKDTLQGHNLQKVPLAALSTKFNDFGVSIEPDYTRFYLNRQEMWRAPTPDEYRQPMYILANLALGGGWPIGTLTPPVTMEIERIQVFQRRSRLDTSSQSPASGRTN